MTNGEILMRYEIILERLIDNKYLDKYVLEDCENKTLKLIKEIKADDIKSNYLNNLLIELLTFINELRDSGDIFGYIKE